MPQIQGVTTKSVKQVWQSPDGQRSINEVLMDCQGKLFKANTFSNDIATVGWSGDVESYEKDGRNGSQTFVKQAPKEGGWSGGQASMAGQTSGSRSSYVPKDEAAIKAMWAIGQSVNALSDKSDLQLIEDYAKELFAMVDRVKTGEDTPDPADATTGNDEIADADKPLDLSLMDEVLGGTKVDEGETPWGKDKK